MVRERRVATGRGRAWSASMGAARLYDGRRGDLAGDPAASRSTVRFRGARPRRTIPTACWLEFAMMPSAGGTGSWPTVASCAPIPTTQPR